MKNKIYIETSVVSYHTNDISSDIVVAGHQVSTRKFWKLIEEKKISPVISALVINEASQGNSIYAKRRTTAINGFEILKVSEKAERLAEILTSKNAVPHQFLEDALHIAIASVESIDFIATWNFKHINNPFTKRKIKDIIENEGFQCPVLCSPEELLEDNI